jgi:hypothetical protein
LAKSTPLAPLRGFTGHSLLVFNLVFPLVATDQPQNVLHLVHTDSPALLVLLGRHKCHIEDGGHVLHDRPATRSAKSASDWGSSSSGTTDALKLLSFGLNMTWIRQRLPWIAYEPCLGGFLLGLVGQACMGIGAKFSLSCRVVTNSGLKAYPALNYPPPHSPCMNLCFYDRYLSICLPYFTDVCAMSFYIPPNFLSRNRCYNALIVNPLW